MSGPGGRRKGAAGAGPAQKNNPALPEAWQGGGRAAIAWGSSRGKRRAIRGGLQHHMEARR